MRDKIEKVLDNNIDYYKISKEDLLNELCVLFGVSKSFYCEEEKITGKPTDCKEQCSYCRCK